MQEPPSRDGLLTTAQAADFLGLSPRSLEGMRHRRSDGPRHVRISARAVRYRRSDLEEWIAEHVRTSTSDPGPTDPDLP